MISIFDVKHLNLNKLGTSILFISIFFGHRNFAIGYISVATSSNNYFKLFGHPERGESMIDIFLNFVKFMESIRQL